MRGPYKVRMTTRRLTRMIEVSKEHFNLCANRCQPLIEAAVLHDSKLSQIGAACFLQGLMDGFQLFEAKGYAFVERVTRPEGFPEPEFMI